MRRTFSTKAPRDRPARLRGGASWLCRHGESSPSLEAGSGDRLALRDSFTDPPDSDILDRAENSPALAVADPSDLREPDPGVGLVELCALREPERIVLALPAERRKARPFFEEVFVGPVEVLEGLLEDL